MALLLWKLCVFGVLAGLVAAVVVYLIQNVGRRGLKARDDAAEVREQLAMFREARVRNQDMRRRLDHIAEALDGIKAELDEERG